MNDAQVWLAARDDEAQTKLILRLTLYTFKEMRRVRYWRSGNNGCLPKGEDAESLVSSVLTKVLEEKRKWDVVKEPDFVHFLMDVIDSELNHLAESNDNKRVTERSEEGAEEQITRERGQLQRHSEFAKKTGWLVRPVPTPDMEFDAKQKEQLEQAALDALEASLSHDEEALFIVRAIRAGCEKAGEISNSTGIEIRRVYDANKRIERRIRKMNQQFRGARGGN
jgi:hypothetical protein